MADGLVPDFMFSDAVDVGRFSQGKNPSAGKVPVVTPADAAVACSWQMMSWQLARDLMLDATASDTAVFFREDARLSMHDVLYLLDDHGMRTGQSAQVQRYRRQRAAHELAIFVAECKLLT